MASKLHVNPKTGAVGACRSGESASGNSRGCPFGEAFHGESPEQCEAIFAEEMLGESTFLTGDLKEGVPRDGVVPLLPHLTADERRAHTAKLAVSGSKVPPMSFVSDGPVDMEKVTEASNPRSTTVPNGGLWLSRTKEEGSDWMASLGEYRSDLGSIVTIQSLAPRPDAKILKIDSFEDLETAMAAYPGSERGWHGKALDIAKLREDGYDGIYLTRKGFLETRPHRDNEFVNSYKPGQENGRTEISAQRVNTHGWIPSMVLFSKDAVGEQGEPRRIHQDGGNVELMEIGERSAASKYSSVEDFVKAQKDPQLLKLTVKYATKKRITDPQRRALELMEKEYLARGNSRDELTESYTKAKKDAHFASRDVKMTILDRTDKRCRELGVKSYDEMLRVRREVTAELERDYESSLSN